MPKNLRLKSARGKGHDAAGAGGRGGYGAF